MTSKHHTTSAAPLLVVGLLSATLTLACAQHSTPATSSAPSAPASAEAAADPRAADAQGANQPGERAELERLLADLCDKRVVLLGEPGGHGDARTWATKSALLTRLIDECGFDAVLFESAIYDFLALDHQLAAGTAELSHLTDAVGEMWSRADLLQPWFAQLLERARAGRVRLGGLTAQVHSTANYARTQLPRLLSDYLPAAASERCVREWQRFMQWQYDDQHPYDEQARLALRECAEAAANAIAAQPSTPLRDEHLVMAQSLGRPLSDAYQSGGEALFNARDRTMYEHFLWYRNRLPVDSRIAVWCATIHAAKDLSGVPGVETLSSLGSHVHAEYGDRAASIGFSAYSGEMARIRGSVTAISEAPPGSLEAEVAPPQGLRYLDRDELRGFGEIVARPLSHDALKQARWDRVLDGLVVFREEQAPRFTTPAAP
ncbi:erythromycin esterase family protein [Haliangium ochraceum]|uniref:erythromycin esterase family protein n=1 Tax=Haliangium ochraceum TaxID=80816 RepID=UPI0003014F37|nr:erythromycin esterase family protein [Haliangium ochraceum]